MMMPDDMKLEELGKFGAPDIEIGALRFWIHDRQFPEMDDFWDGNWVNATVHCSAKGAEVRIQGPFLHLPELKKWAEDCQQMYATLSGHAHLECMEPELDVKMEMAPTGHVKMTVNITPDNLDQNHQFDFSIDQSYLPSVVRGCNTVLEKFPIRGVP